MDKKPKMQNVKKGKDPQKPRNGYTTCADYEMDKTTSFYGETLFQDDNFPN
jgi:hypothetical protein